MAAWPRDSLPGACALVIVLGHRDTELREGGLPRVAQPEQTQGAGLASFHPLFTSWGVKGAGLNKL